MVRSLFSLGALSLADAQYYAPESRGVSRFVRQFFPGGPHSVMYNGSFNSTYNPYAFKGPITVHPDGLHEQTFASSPLNLRPGEVVNNYIPINWPEGKVHIKSYNADIVKLKPGRTAHEVGPDGLPDTVPATRHEVYLHHWTVNKWQMGKEEYDDFAKNGGRDFGSTGHDAGITHGMNGPCGFKLLHFLFGAGNEVRGPPLSGENATYFFPDPYGIESDSDEMHENGILALFNAHLIDIRGVDNVRGCTECECDVTGVDHQGPNYTGGLECCHSTYLDGGHCSSTAAPDVQSYFVQYTLTWRKPDDPVYHSAPFKPLNSMILDQSDNGAQWYDPVALPGTSMQSHKALYGDPVSMDSLNGGHSGEYYDGHLKIRIDAGLKPRPHVRPHIDLVPAGCHAEYYVPPCNSSDRCEHRFRNSWTMPFDMEVIAVHNHMHKAAINMTSSIWNGAHICTGLPTYKDDFLVEASQCTAGDQWQPVPVKRGQDILVETFYSQDQKPHYGVMGYAMMYIHRLDIKDTVMV